MVLEKKPKDKKDSEEYRRAIYAVLKQEVKDFQMHMEHQFHNHTKIITLYTKGLEELDESSDIRTGEQNRPNTGKSA